MEKNVQKIKTNDLFEKYGNEQRWVNYSKSKIPINPHNLYNGKSTSAETWSNLQTALDNIGKTASLSTRNGYKKEEIRGVGIILGDGLCGIDLDHCISDDGVIDDFAQDIIQQMDSYTERSPSGDGIHILFVGHCPVSTMKVSVDGKSRELYTKDRYLTCTGNVFEGHTKVNERTTQIGAVYEQYYEHYARDKPKVTPKKKANKDVLIESNEAFEAIQKHDHTYFVQTLQEELKQFSTNEEFFSYIYSYPLSDFLGVKERKSFNCFFHEDKSPSASVFQTRESNGSIWQYHCFSEDITLNIKELVRKIGNFRADFEALDFIKKCLNIEILDNKWALAQKNTIITISKQFDSDDFKTLCPTANKNLRWTKELYRSIIQFAYEHILPTTNQESADVIFFMSKAEITQYAKKRDEDKTEQWIKALAYHGLIKILADDEIPEDALNKAREMAKAKAKEQKRRARRTSFYKLTAPLDYKVIEEQAVKWKANGYKREGVSYEMFKRTEGETVANSLYPQLNKSGSTVSDTALHKAEKRHEKLHDLCLELLDKQGYFTQKQLIDASDSKYWGNLQVNRSLQDICNLYGIKKVRANKELKETYSIDADGYPYIYISI